MGGRMAWKPIETAPKDGRPLLLFDGDPHIGYYEDPWEKVIHHPPWSYVENGVRIYRPAYDHTIQYGGWMTPAASCVESCQWRLEPTHWDELPEPPDGGTYAVDSQASEVPHQEGRQVEGGG
jgi:hypothetical protein